MTTRTGFSCVCSFDVGGGAGGGKNRVGLDQTFRMRNPQRQVIMGCRSDQGGGVDFKPKNSNVDCCILKRIRRFPAKVLSKLMSNSLTQGAGYALTGLRWLPKSGLRRFVAMPLLINACCSAPVSGGRTVNWNGWIRRCKTWLAGLAGLAALADLAVVCPDRAGRSVLHLFRSDERDRRAV
jgi:hypothetical protein